MMKINNILLFSLMLAGSCTAGPDPDRVDDPRERYSINEGWTFYRYASDEPADDLIYDVRPHVTDLRDDRVADARPTNSVDVPSTDEVLKPWIMPTGNAFLKNPGKQYDRPRGTG